MQSIAEAVLSTASATLGVPIENLVLSTRPDHLQEWDSLAHVMLIEALEERFGVELGEEEVFDIESIGGLIDAFEGKLGPEEQR